MKPAFSLWIALMNFFVPFCLSAQVISTYAGTGQSGYTGNGGPATAAQLSDPLGVCADASGNIYIADHSNHVIRKVSPDGTINNFAGSGEYGYSGDGGLAIDAALEYPFGLYADNTGNIYFTDRLRCVVRKVNSSGIITTIAGSGISGYAGDGGLATNARLHAPMGIGGDRDGNIYVVEFVNLIVRKVSRDGVITTFAGNGRLGYSGDGGPAVNASFNSPVGVWVDEQGNVFVADTDNFAIRKINKSGTITTVAGNGTWGYSGDGGLAKAAQLKSLYGIYVNEKGELYIGDSGNGVVRKVNTSGIIETVAGNGIKAYTGDGGHPLDAAFIAPTFLCEDKNANLYIADGQSHVIRKIGPCATVAIRSQPADVSVCDAGSATFMVTTDHAKDFQWQVNPGAGWTDIQDSEIYIGTGTTELYIAKAVAGINNNRYRCIVRNTCSADTSIAALLTIADPATPLTLNIEAGADPLCTGSNAVFKAIVTPGSAGLVYEWTVNGLLVGDSGAELQTTAIANGDVLRCRIIGDNHCIMDDGIISDAVILEVVPTVVSSVSVVASANEICEGTSVDFIASAINEGDAPHYQWRVNGVDAGTNSVQYSTNELKNGDLVTCELTSNLACSSPAVSENKLVVVHPKIKMHFDPSEVLIEQGGSTVLRPVIDGQAAQYQWRPLSGLNNPSIKEPMAAPLQSTIYELEISSDKGCTTSETVAVKIYRALQMPSAFTPNNDGINDVFRVPPEFSIKLHSFSIYNRWGQRIFNTSDVERGWDGQNSNQQQPEGIYTWVIRYEDPLTGKAITAKGNVTLIK